MEQEESFFNDKAVFSKRIKKETDQSGELEYLHERLFDFANRHYIRNRQPSKPLSPTLLLFFEDRLSDTMTYIFNECSGLFQESFEFEEKKAISSTLLILSERRLRIRIANLDTSTQQFLEDRFSLFGVDIKANWHETSVELTLRSDFGGFVEDFPINMRKIEFLGFRGFQDTIRLKLRNINLFIGKNNTGKTNLLELFRLCSGSSTYELLGSLEEYGNMGSNDAAGFLFGNDYEKRTTIQVGFHFNTDIYLLKIRWDNPNGFVLEYSKNKLIFCVVLLTGLGVKAKVFWQKESISRFDGRKVRSKFISNQVREDFQKLNKLFFGDKKIAIHFASKDQKSLIDEFEVALHSFEGGDVTPFFEEIHHHFEIPKLQFMKVMGSSSPLVIRNDKQKADIESRYKEVCELEALLKKFKHKNQLDGIKKEIEIVKDSLKSTRGAYPMGGHLSVRETNRKAKDFGSGFRAILLLLLKIRQNDIILIDEPETFLHHSLQVKLADYIIEKAKGKQFFIASHSEVFLNRLFGHDKCAIYQTDNDQNNFVVQEIKKDNINDLIDDLGIKASYLLQSNCIIWVEGPSDRVFIKRWLELTSKGLLKEGIHYQCVSYGGRLLSNLSFNSRIPNLNSDDVSQLLTINRNAIILMDSDRRSEKDSINKTKSRIMDEIEKNGGFAWVTAGREIENYIPESVLFEVSSELNGNFGQFDKISDYFKDSDEKLSSWYLSNKKDFAILISKKISRDSEKPYDLEEKLNEITSLIMSWNGIDMLKGNTQK